MEPKSIAFYTAVAVSILAVISATTFPTLALAQPDPPSQEQSTQQSTQADNGATADKPDPKADNGATADKPDPKADTAKSNDKSDDGGATKDNGAGSQSLGLDPSRGVASCGQIVTE